MKNISKEDYILWDSFDECPTERLDNVYHYTTIIELMNDGFRLNRNEEWICVASLPISLQKQISEAIEKTK